MRKLMIFFALAMGSTASADTGDWWCDAGWKWPDLMGVVHYSIPVYISADLPSHMNHADGTPWAADELQYEVQFMLERIMDQSASNMPPLRFAGWEASGAWDAAPTPGAITLRVNGGAGDCRSGFMNGNWLTGVRAFFADTTRCAGKWEHWRLEGPGMTTIKTFGGTLFHELMHGFGFDHQNLCNPTPPTCTDNPSDPSRQICGTMQGHGLNSEDWELESSDVFALRKKYGSWAFDGKLRRFSSAGFLYGTHPTDTWRSMPYVTASWPGVLTSPDMPLASIDQNSQPHTWLWRRTTDVYTDWGASSGGVSQIGQIAVAGGGSPFKMVTLYMSDQNETVTVKQPRYSVKTSPTGATTVVSSTQEIGRHGHSGTIDPRFNQMVHLWRDNDNNIMMALSAIGAPPGTAGTPGPLAGDSNAAAYTPSVSCGDPSLTYNCIMVWASAAKAAGEKYHLLKWIHFRMVAFVEGGYYLEFANQPMTDPSVQFGPPNVVFRGASGADNAWEVAFKNPGQCYFTLRKDASTTATWVGAGTHCSGSARFNGPPMIGMTAAITEPWAVYNQE